MQYIPFEITPKEAKEIGYTVCPNKSCQSTEVEILKTKKVKCKLTKSIAGTKTKKHYFCTWCGTEFTAN